MVTGAGGMTGSELARQARSRNWTCASFERADLDISDYNAVDDAARAVAPDVIVNAAAYTAVDTAEAERDAAMRVNRDGAANVARAASRIGAAIIHISSDYVFDGTSSRPYLPDDPINPLGVYGESKAEGERSVRNECAAHLIVRTSWVYSHRGRNFVLAMLRAGEEGRQEVRVVTDQRGSPTSARDVAAALLDAAETVRDNPESAGTYHFSNSGITSWFEFAAAIFEFRGGDSPRLVPISTSEYPTRARRPQYSALDTTSFERTFKVTPRPWQDALRDTLAGLR